MDETPVPSLQIKGIRDGLLVRLDGGEWSELLAALVRSIDERPDFYRGARLTLDVAAQELRVVEMSALRDMLSERGISLWAVLSESSLTEQTAQNLGLATRIAKPARHHPREAEETESAGAPLWIQQTVRSGQRIVHEGNVVVMGDVNPGAEILASGSIIVWGRLRGVVHAGAQGDDQAVICALELSPTQLRIAGEIAISPARKGKPKPETARLKGGRIEAETWQA